MGVTGTYQDVDAPARLSMNWQWSGESVVSHVTIELHEAGTNQTMVVVPHPANPSATDRDDHLQGWRDCLGRLLQEYGPGVT